METWPVLAAFGAALTWDADPLIPPHSGWDELDLVDRGGDLPRRLARMRERTELLLADMPADPVPAGAGAARAASGGAGPARALPAGAARADRRRGRRPRPRHAAPPDRFAAVRCRATQAGERLAAVAGRMLGSRPPGRQAAETG